MKLFDYVEMNNGNGTTNTDETHSRADAIKETLTNYSQESSVHGVKYIGGIEIARTRRIVWAVAIFLSLFFCAFMIYPRAEVYAKWPVSTKVSHEYKSPLPFPAVTICNLNMVRLSYIDSYPALQPLATMPPVGFHYKATEATLRGYRKFIYDDVLYEGGNILNETIIQCFWLNNPIKCTEYFTERLTSYGKCFTFNSNEYSIRNGGKPLETSTSGSAHALWIRINIQQSEYAVSVGLSAGIKVLVHDQSEEPLIQEFGFAVGPGVEALAAIRAQRLLEKLKVQPYLVPLTLIYYLPAPYEGGMCRNMSDPNVANPLKYFTDYSHSSCRRECYLKKIFQICNCSVFIRDTNYKQCTLEQYMRCVDSADPEVSDDKCNPKCIPPCTVTNYHVQVSHALMPSDRIAQFFFKMSNTTKEMSRNNYIDMRVYFEELNFDSIRQVPEYQWQQLIGDIGGQLGFCLGASILSLYEILEFIVVFAIKSLTHVTGKKKRVKPDNAINNGTNDKKNNLVLTELY